MNKQINYSSYNLSEYLITLRIQLTHNNIMIYVNTKEESQITI